MPSAGYNILKPSGQDKYDWVDEFKRPPPKRLILLDKEKEIVFSETRIEGIGFHLAYTVYSKLVASHAYQASRKVERMYLTSSPYSESCRNYIIKKCGVNPYEHLLEFKYSSKSTSVHRTLLIDGIPVYCWVRIFTDRCKVDITSIRKTIKLAKIYHKEEYIPIISEKYKDIIYEYNRNFVALHDLPEFLISNPTPLSGQMYVFGVPMSLWQLLNNPNHIPVRSTVSRWITFFRKYGNEDQVKSLEERFDYLIHPKKRIVISEDAAMEARGYLYGLLRTHFNEATDNVMVKPLPLYPSNDDIQEVEYDNCS